MKVYSIPCPCGGDALCEQCYGSGRIVVVEKEPLAYKQILAALGIVLAIIALAAMLATAWYAHGGF